MNPAQGEKYTSIFQRKEKTKKGNGFYSQSLVEVTEMISKKKVKREEKEEDSSPKKNSKLFESVHIEIADHNTVQKICGFSVVQKMLQWIFLKDFTNPLWVSISNKDLIQHVVFLVVSGLDAQRVETYLSKENTPFLEKYKNLESKCYMKGSHFFNPINERFWELFFTTKQSNEINPAQKKKKVRNLNGEDGGSLTYEDILRQKYEGSILSKDELQINLYPMNDLPVYMDYLCTADYQPDGKQSIKDLILGVDCEMVRTAQGMELARLTLINFDYQVIYDEFVKPDNDIEDYLTKWSGITPEIMGTATKSLKDAQKDFLRFCNAESILVGHSLENDLHALKIIHNRIVDTSVLYQNAKGYKTSLRNLAHTYLHIEIQKGTHDSSEDAKSALALARMKIEILDNFENYHEKKRTAQLDILENIFQAKRTVLPLDEEPYINPLLKYAISYDEVKSSKFEEVTSKMLKWLKMRASGIASPSLLTGAIRDMPIEADTNEEQTEGPLVEYFRKLDKRIEELAEQAEKNTVFLIVFSDSCEKKPDTEKRQTDRDTKAYAAIAQEQAKRMQSLGLFFVHK